MGVTTTSNQVEDVTKATYVSDPMAEKRKPGRPRFEKVIEDEQEKHLDSIAKEETVKAQQAMPGASYGSATPSDTAKLMNMNVVEVAKRIGTGRLISLNSRKFAVISGNADGTVQGVALDDIGTTMNRIMQNGDNKRYKETYGENWLADVKRGVLPAEWEKELPIVRLDPSMSDDKKKEQVGV